MQERMLKPEDAAMTRSPKREQEAVARRAPLQVGAANDSAEREADSVADRVVEHLGLGSPVAEVAETRVQRKATGAVGPEGGEVDADTEARLDRTRGGGSPLESTVRRSMEDAFGGASFGDVRIHSGGESADLSTRLGAQAFTVDKDIYLGSGTPSPSTPAGQHLLAHELAHTQQQSGGAQRSVVQRLDVDKPIKKVKTINVFPFGSSGQVAEVSDGGKPVVVKVDQKNAAEVVAADKLMRGGKFKSGRHKVKAPKSRLANGADIAELKAKVNLPGVMVSPDPRDFVKGLDGSNQSIIAESLSGANMQQKLTGAVTSSQGTDEAGEAVTTVRRDDAFIEETKKLFKSSSAIKAMSKALAADCAMAQGDRVLHQFAPANFKYDGKKKTFSFIDNTQSSAAGTLVDKMTKDGFMNARASFNQWADVEFVRWLRTDLDSLANKIVDNFTGCDANGDANYTGIIGEFDPINANKAERGVKTEIFNELKGLAVANRSKMVGAAKAGLEAGRSTVIKQLANPLALDPRDQEPAGPRPGRDIPGGAPAGAHRVPEGGRVGRGEREGAQAPEAALQARGAGVGHGLDAEAPPELRAASKWWRIAVPDSPCQEWPRTVGSRT